MQRELRAFVQAASGIHGTEWHDYPLPEEFAVPSEIVVDDPEGQHVWGRVNELQIPRDEVFVAIIAQTHHWYAPVTTESRPLPTAYYELDLYDPPHTTHGSWLTFREILHHGWSHIVPHTTEPLFNPEDIGKRALPSCEPALALLGRVLACADQTPSNMRLIFWLSPA